MKCAEVRVLSHRQLDGELDPEAAVCLEQHLGNCTECRRERDELVELRSLVREVGEVDRPAASHSETRPAPRWKLIPLGSGLAAAAALVVALLYLTHGTHPPAPPSKPPGSRPRASLEVATAQQDSVIVVELRSQQSNVHVFWLYANVSEKGDTP